MEVYQSAQTTQLERETQPQGGWLLFTMCERVRLMEGFFLTEK